MNAAPLPVHPLYYFVVHHLVRVSLECVFINIYKLDSGQELSRPMFRFVGFKNIEAPKDVGTSLILDKVPDKTELLGDFKISRLCSGFVQYFISRCFHIDDCRRSYLLLLPAH